MTTIACDRGTMAADTKVNVGDTSYKGTKIWRVGKVIVGMAGTALYCTQFLEKVREKSFTPFVLTEKDTEDPEGVDFYGLILSPEGIVFVDCMMNQEFVQEPFYAIGSGAQAARAAMMMGADPVKSVKVAAQLDSGTGLPVKALRLKGVQCTTPTKK